MNKLLAIVVAALILLPSCGRVASMFDDDLVVATVGKHKLLRTQLEAFIPADATPEDSVNLAMQYINKWASELLFLNVAETQLSKSELDIAPEIEDFRRSLLKYRYEQRYVNERLDTLITKEQVESYYSSHKESFHLQRPIMKVRFVDVMKDSPNSKALISALSSPTMGDIDSLAFASALRYFDSSDTWKDAAVLAREFGTDYATMLSAMDKNNLIRIETPDKGDVKAMYVCDIVQSGTAPLDYCYENIRDIILSSRKHELLVNLEKEIIQDALSRGTFVIN